jgi:hypothetical protein
VHLRHAPTANLLSLCFYRLCLFISTDFTDFGSPSHMPPTTYISKLPAKINPRVVHPTLSTESTSRQHKSSQVERLGSLRELSPLRLPQNRRALLLSLSCPKITFLGCVPLFSYRLSKGHHREPSHPLGVSPLHEPMSKQIVAHVRGPNFLNESFYPFVNPVAQMKPCAHQSSCPLGSTCPTLVHPSCRCTRILLVASYLGKPLVAFACPRHSLAQLGCWRNPKVSLLEDLGEGLCAHLSKGLTPGLNLHLFNHFHYMVRKS